MLGCIKVYWLNKALSNGLVSLNTVSQLFCYLITKLYLIISYNYKYIIRHV